MINTSSTITIAQTMPWYQQFFIYLLGPEWIGSSKNVNYGGKRRLHTSKTAFLLVYNTKLQWSQQHRKNADYLAKLQANI